MRINKLCTDFISNLLKIRKDSISKIQLCHKIVIYVVNLVYIAYISLLLLYCNGPLPIIVNAFVPIKYCLLSITENNVREYRRVNITDAQSRETGNIEYKQTLIT